MHAECCPYVVCDFRDLRLEHLYLLCSNAEISLFLSKATFSSANKER